MMKHQIFRINVSVLFQYVNRDSVQSMERSVIWYILVLLKKTPCHHSKRWKQTFTCVLISQIISASGFNNNTNNPLSAIWVTKMNGEQFRTLFVPAEGHWRDPHHQEQDATGPGNAAQTRRKKIRGRGQTEWLSCPFLVFSTIWNIFMNFCESFSLEKPSYIQFIDHYKY